MTLMEVVFAISANAQYNVGTSSRYTDCDARGTSAGSWCRERYSLLLVWSAHVFVLPAFYHAVVEHALVP